jgi:septal ring factor EnvC (AmiA/AmiB activator)
LRRPAFRIALGALLLGAALAWHPPATLAADPPSKGAPRKNVKPGTKAATPKKPATASPAKPAASPQRQKELQSEQQELKQQLNRLKQQLMAAEASRTEAADALAASEAAISRANRRLRELGEDRLEVERQIDSLQQRSRSVAASQSRQEAQLAETLRQHHRLTLRDPFQAFLAGDNPGDLTRDAEYYGYLGRAAAQRIGELQERRVELANLEEQSRLKGEELARIADDENTNRAQLLSEQGRRKQAMERLSKQIATQRQSIDKLERDERRLATLIDRLSRVLAEQARREAQREAERKARETAKAEAPSRPAPGPGPRTAPPPRDAEPPPSGQFAQLRGRLPMPVVGEVTGRFGAPRKVEGAGTAPTWKGIFIRAAAGTGVRAVAAGQVVFADWLRGFGNLMVVDHGEGFLSVYGNNESLLRNVGDRVAVGDLVAAVGNTGGIEQTGLYFELRFQGRPFDPLKWVAAR